MLCQRFTFYFYLLFFITVPVITKSLNQSPFTMKVSFCQFEQWYSVVYSPYPCLLRSWHPPSYFLTYFTIPLGPLSSKYRIVTILILPTGRLFAHSLAQRLKIRFPFFVISLALSETFKIPAPVITSFLAESPYHSINKSGLTFEKCLISGRTRSGSRILTGSSLPRFGCNKPIHQLFFPNSMSIRHKYSMDGKILVQFIEASLILIQTFIIAIASITNLDKYMIMRKLIDRCFSTSVNKEEMELFKKITNWWHPSGPNQMLHLYNYERIKFLKRNLQKGNSEQNFVKPLLGMRVLDVGCGAGFLSESLTRLGATVTALDPNPTSFLEANAHKGTRSDLRELTYHNTSIQQFIENNTFLDFDLVTSMQVIEHVNDPSTFISNLSKCCSNSGMVMLSTIRRSMQTYLTHIIGAQKIAKIVPEGTHHHQKFINPEECIKMMKTADLQAIDKLELDINYRGQFVEVSNGGNYLIMGKKIQRVVEQEKSN